MVRIEDTNYYIDADARQYILREWDGTTVYKDGKPEFKHIWYYSDFENLLYGLQKHMVREEIAMSKSLTELNNRILAIRFMIEKFMSAFTLKIGGSEQSDTREDDESE
jgi:hypothetical protein